MSVEFKIAEEHHLLKIIELLADDELGKNRENYQNPLPDGYIIAFKNILADKNQELIVVINENEEVIGTLQLSYLQYLTYGGGIRAQIEAVRIRKEERNKGYGTLFFNWAIERSKAKGAHLLQLTTDKKRMKAKEFYEKLGFTASHEGMKMTL